VIKFFDLENKKTHRETVATIPGEQIVATDFNRKNILKAEPPLKRRKG
jgi:hypothetical protein